jgi:hypothetical protein
MKECGMERERLKELRAKTIDTATDLIMEASDMNHTIRSLEQAILAPILRLVPGPKLGYEDRYLAAVSRQED